MRTPSDADPGERLVYLESQLDAWLDRYAPEVVAVERVFADVNVALRDGDGPCDGGRAAHGQPSAA